MNRARAAARAIDYLDTNIAMTKALASKPAAPTMTVDYPQRLITVIAAPYDQPADVIYRGQMWRELFVRGAFAHIEVAGIRVNRDHDKSRTVGKVIRFDPSDHRGLIATIKIARTTLGDETLALADEDMLSASLGFTVPAGGQQLRGRIRTITRASIDHIALVEAAAYEGAKVLEVRIRE